MQCGVVDVGSNTVRLSIYECGPARGAIRLLLNEKEPAGLAGYIRNGMMTEEGILTACRILDEFHGLLDRLEIREQYFFGTAPLRNISNTEQVLDSIAVRTGIQVEVLSGAEEAAFALRGALSEGGAPDGLLADIGGGSTELVAYRDKNIQSSCSLPIGSLSLYTKYTQDLFPTRNERRKMRRRVEQELDRVAFDSGALHGCKKLMGVGGSVRAAARLCRLYKVCDTPSDNQELSAKSVGSLYRSLKQGDPADLRRVLRAAPDRVHTIVPGLLILKTILSRFEIQTVHVSTRGVREGYLLARVLTSNAREVRRAV